MIGYSTVVKFFPNLRSNVNRTIRDSEMPKEEGCLEEKKKSKTLNIGNVWNSY